MLVAFFLPSIFYIVSHKSVFFISRCINITTSSLIITLRYFSFFDKCVRADENESTESSLDKNARLTSHAVLLRGRRTFEVTKM